MNTAISLDIAHQYWPISGGFRISRGQKTAAETIVVTLQSHGHSGRGECVPYARYGESIDSVCSQIETLRGPLQNGLTREQLQKILPAGAARNAIDCAFWDLEAQILQKPVWELAALEPPIEQVTAFTLSISNPDQMAMAAQRATDYPVLKVKLAGDQDDILRIKAICSARPNAQLILDGNEGFCAESLQTLCDKIQGLNIAAIEQPLPADIDDELSDIDTEFILCADESLHTSDDLAHIARMYQMINIKLDKTGGLTEALRLHQQANKFDLQIMVGCMVSTSLSMLPALLLANSAKLVDLDGPLLLAKDHDKGLQYRGAIITAKPSHLWGYPRRRSE